MGDAGRTTRATATETRPEARRWAWWPTSSFASCTAAAATSADASTRSSTPRILALNHSFIVDNWGCGGSSGNLTVHGAIAQYFRGPVGQVGSSGGVSNGYAKNYSYDDRLANILPPYLFDISNSGWHVSRETVCTAGSTNSTFGCQAP